MSGKNSTESDTKSYCEFYSGYWEEIVPHTNQDLFESDGDSDLSVHIHPNRPNSSFENKKEKSKLSESVLFPENNQTNLKNRYKDRPLLQAQPLENTRQFHEELSPKLSPSEAYSSKIFPYVCDGSCKDNLCLNIKISHPIIAEKWDKQPCFNTIKESYATYKVRQKQPLDDHHPTSIENKASLSKKASLLKQNFTFKKRNFHCRKEETGPNITCECFERSAISTQEVNQKLDRKSIISYNSENICHKKTTSSQLIKEHLECSLLSSSQSGSSQAAEQTYVHAGSEGLTISLTLEADPIDTIGSLAVDISPSKTREDEEDSQHHALDFKFTDSENNNLFDKLCISIIPSISYSEVLETESQELITPFTKQTGLLKDLVDEASQPLTTCTKSPEASSSDILTDQVPSTLKRWSAKLLPSYKAIHETQSSYLFIRSIPYSKIIPKAEVQKHQLKPYRPDKSYVFTKHKDLQKDKVFRNRPYSISKLNWPSTWAVELFPYQSVNDLVINELDYSPLTWFPTTCHCSPLLDLTVDLHSDKRYSGTEKTLRVHRKPHKQVRGGKVIPRFSSQYLLTPRSSFDSLQYLFPRRRKSNLRMHSIVTSFLGEAKERNKHESYQGKVCSTPDNSNAGGNGPCAPADGRYLVTAPLSRTVNSYIQHSPALLPPTERRHSPTMLLQTERETLKPAEMCPNCKCRNSHSPYTAYIVNVVQPPKEKNVVNSLSLVEPNLGAAQVACEDLILNKFSFCPCGNVPGHGLFPSTDISWSDEKKTNMRASSNMSQRASMSESKKVTCPERTFNTDKVCCTNCHHCFPTCFCFHNMNRQDASRNQCAKVQFSFESGLPNRNPEGFEEKSNAVKKAERKNGRIHMGTDTLQEFIPSHTHTGSPSKDGSRIPKYVMCCPECCSGCQSAVHHLGTSKEVFDSYSSKQKMLHNSMNRRSVFVMDPGPRTRSQCRCSQEISPFHVDQADIYKVKRAMLSKREEFDVMQDSSGLIRDGKGLDENH